MRTRLVRVHRVEVRNHGLHVPVFIMDSVLSTHMSVLSTHEGVLNTHECVQDTRVCAQCGHDWSGSIESKSDTTDWTYLLCVKDSVLSTDTTDCTYLFCMKDSVLSTDTTDCTYLFRMTDSVLSTHASVLSAHACVQDTRVCAQYGHDRVHRVEDRHHGLQVPVLYDG